MDARLMKWKRKHYQRDIDAIDRLQAKGLLTDPEARRAVSRLQKVMNEDHLCLEKTGFREYRVIPQREFEVIEIS